MFIFHNIKVHSTGNNLQLITAHTDILTTDIKKKRLIILSNTCHDNTSAILYRIWWILNLFTRMSACLIVKNIVAQTVFRYTEMIKKACSANTSTVTHRQKNQTISGTLPQFVEKRAQTFFARDSIYAIALCGAIRHRPSVRPSVCLLSHGWISQRRLKLGSCNLHHRVAPWL